MGWTYRWVTARGMWMDSLGSTETVKDWVEYVNSDEQSRNVRANMSAYEGYVPNAPPGSCSGSSCPYVNKGKRMGYFLYGGSLNILLFEPGVFNSMDLLMGNRLGSMSPKARK